MNTCPLKLSLAVLFAGAAFGAARADVWQDCTAWYVGGADAVGAFKNGDMTDIRHAAIADSPTHGGAIRGTNEGVSNRCETVYSAASGRTFENQRTIYLPQADGIVYDSKQKKDVYKVTDNQVALPFPATNVNYTLLMRVKLDATQPTNRTWVHVADLGYTGSNPKHAFAVRYYPATEQLGLVYNAGNGKPVYASPTNNLCTSLRGKWLELSVSLKYNKQTSSGRDNSTMRVGVAAEGLDRTYASTAYDFPAGQSVPSADLIYLGGNSKQNGMSTNACSARASYQMVSYWERVLTDAEILEAFKLDANDKFYRADKTTENHPALLKFGDTAWGGDVFGGTADGDAAIVTDFQNLGKFPGKLAAGKSLSIPFTVPATVTNLRQVVRVCAAKGSASLKFAIDGTESDAIGVLAGGTASYVFDRPCFTEGAHTLTISRVDSGVEALQLSAIEISGSWRLGWIDGDIAPCAKDSGTVALSCDVSDLTTNGWKDVRGTFKTTTTTAYRSELGVDLHEEDVATRTMTLRAKPFSGNKASADFLVLTNGAEAVRKPLIYDASAERDERYDLISIPFKPGSLSSGRNTFLFKLDRTYTVSQSPWMKFDYYELEVDKKPNGLTMQVK